MYRAFSRCHFHAAIFTLPFSRCHFHAAILTLPFSRCHFHAAHFRAAILTLRIFALPFSRCALAIARSTVAPKNIYVYIVDLYAGTKKPPKAETCHVLLDEDLLGILNIMFHIRASQNGNKKRIVQPLHKKLLIMVTRVRSPVGSCLFLRLLNVVVAISSRDCCSVCYILLVGLTASIEISYWFNRLSTTHDNTTNHQ